MKEKKLNTAIKCLLATALVQILSVAYSVTMVLKTRGEVAKLIEKDPATMISSVEMPAVFGPSVVMTSLILVAIYFVILDLRKGKGWAWVGALILFLISTPSFALPFAIFGMICLLDERVRNDFIAQLDIAI